MDEQLKETERGQLGERLRAARTKAGLSLVALGKLLDISSSTLWRVESQQAGSLDFENEVKIKRWLNIPLSTGYVTASGDTLKNIKAAIYADESLDKEVAEALYDLMEVAYKKFAKKWL